MEEVEEEEEEADEVDEDGPDRPWGFDRLNDSSIYSLFSNIRKLIPNLTL